VIRGYGLLVVVLAIGCAREKDPYDVPLAEARAAAAKIRPSGPHGGLPPKNGDQPIQMELPPPKKRERRFVPPSANGEIPPGAIPLRSGSLR